MSGSWIPKNKIKIYCPIKYYEFLGIVVSIF